MYKTLYERGSEQSQKHSHTNGDLTHKSITSELGGKGGPLNSNLSHSHWALGRHSFDSLTFLRARDRWLDSSSISGKCRIFIRQCPPQVHSLASSFKKDY